MNLKPISAEWEKFAEVFLPPHAPKMQRLHMRLAFFAGAASLNGLLLKSAHTPDDVTIDVKTKEENIKRIFEAVNEESSLFLECIMMAEDLSERWRATPMAANKAEG